MIACKYNHLRMLTAVLQRIDDPLLLRQEIAAAATDGNTALILACEITRELHEKALAQAAGSRPRPGSHNPDLSPMQQQPLMPGQLSPKELQDKLAIVRMLLESGAPPNAKRPSDGRTALHFAVSNRLVQAVRLLLEFRANANEAALDSETPDDLADDRVVDLQDRINALSKEIRASELLDPAVVEAKVREVASLKDQKAQYADILTALRQPRKYSRLPSYGSILDMPPTIVPAAMKQQQQPQAKEN